MQCKLLSCDKGSEELNNDKWLNNKKIVVSKNVLTSEQKEKMLVSSIFLLFLQFSWLYQRKKKKIAI